MATFADSIKEFINVNGLAAKIKTLEAELSVLKTLQATLGGKRRGKKPGRPPGSKVKAPNAKDGKRTKRGAVGEAIKAYLANKGSKGAHVKDIAAAVKSKPVNVTAFFYAPANKKAYKKVAPATFALIE